MVHYVEGAAAGGGAAASAGSGDMTSVSRSSAASPAVVFLPARMTAR